MEKYKDILMELLLDKYRSESAYQTPDPKIGTPKIRCSGTQTSKPEPNPEPLFSPFPDSDIEDYIKNELDKTDSMRQKICRIERLKDTATSANELEHLEQAKLNVLKQKRENQANGIPDRVLHGDAMELKCQQVLDRHYKNPFILNDFDLYVYLPNQRREIQNIWVVRERTKADEPKKNYFILDEMTFIINNQKPGARGELKCSMELPLSDLTFLPEYDIIRYYLKNKPIGHKLFESYSSAGSLTNIFPKKTGFSINILRHFHSWRAQKQFRQGQQKVIAKWLLHTFNVQNESYMV